MLILLLDLPEQALQALKFLDLQRHFLLMPIPYLLDLFLQLILLGDFHEHLVPHGFEICLEEFRLGLVGVPGIVVVVYLIIGRFVFLGALAVLSKGLILEGIKGGISLSIGVS